MSPLTYKPNLDDVLPRLRRLYERRATDRIYAAFDVPSPTLGQFAAEYGDAYCEYPDLDARTAFWDGLLRERSGLTDDSVPSAYLSEMDQGLYGGLLGGDVRFVSDPATGWISSMVAPILDDWSQLESLRFDTSHPWYVRYVDQVDAFVRAAAGKFGVSHFILIDSLNFVFELIGATATYMAMIDEPEMVRRAVDFAFDLNVSLQTVLFDRAGLLEGGTCSNMVGWIPGRIVSESVDPFHMTSVGDFERWGRGPVERIMGHFDGGVVHIHGNGRHLLEAVCTIVGLKAIYLGDDRGFPKAFDILPELRRRAGDMPLVVAADWEPFCEKLARRELPGGVYYHVKNAPNAEAVNRRMDLVRTYRT